MLAPPSTNSVCPVTYADKSLARYNTAYAISSIFPGGRGCILSSISCKMSPSPSGDMYGSHPSSHHQNQPRRYIVHPDTVRCIVQCHGPCSGVHRPFCAGIDIEPRHGHSSVNRRDIDDISRLILHHRRQKLSAEIYAAHIIGH